MFARNVSARRRLSKDRRGISLWDQEENAHAYSTAFAGLLKALERWCEGTPDVHVSSFQFDLP